MEENENIDKIKELVDVENEIAPIKSSDQFFIQQHYKHIPLEQLCLATDLTPEEVTQYIEDYENYLKARGVNPERRFQLNIGMDAAGILSYSIEWPDLNSIEPMIPYVGKFFYVLNDGKLKGSMAQFLANYANEKGTYKIVEGIMKQWNDLAQKENTTALIEPHEVFGGE